MKETVLALNHISQLIMPLKGNNQLCQQQYQTDVCIYYRLLILSEDQLSLLPDKIKPPILDPSAEQSYYFYDSSAMIQK